MVSLRKRFWIELLFSALAVVLFVATVINAQWIERVGGIDPDNGSGESEWSLTLGCVLLVAVFAYAARREWRRARPSTA
jgi:hypothetical protein